MKISVVTAVKNRELSIARAMKSVLRQDVEDYTLEYVIVDGASTDNTLEEIRNLADYRCLVLSEPDSGIYDAINKGILASSGDVIAILHSDDFYANRSVLSDVRKKFSLKQIDVLCTDIVFFKVTSEQEFCAIRRYKSDLLVNKKLCLGGMPAHPGMFIKRSVYEQVGLYSTQFSICGDFDFYKKLVLNSEFKFEYNPVVTVNMEIGGISTTSFASKGKIVAEKLDSLSISDIWSKSIFIYSRYAYLKIFEFFLNSKKPIEKWY